MFEKIAENKFGSRIKIVRSDNGGEYKNARMNEYLKQRGIVMENSAPYTPQQNGKAERANRTIFECARTMLRATDLPKNLWAEAVSTAVYILNRTTHSSRKNLKTPYEVWTGRKPNLQHVRIFGTTAYAHVPKQFRRKLDDKSEKLVLIGYQGESSNYRLYDKEKKKIHVSRDVTFNEKSVPEESENGRMNGETLVLPRIEGAAEEIIDISDGEEDVIEPIQEEPRQQNEPIQEEPRQQNEQQEDDNRRQLRRREDLRRPVRFLDEVDIVEYETPETFRDAVNGPDNLRWIKSINDELSAHEKNNTWTLVKRTDEMRLIDSKWVFKIVRGKTNKERRYKARLCAEASFKRKVSTMSKRSHLSFVMTPSECSWHEPHKKISR